MPHDLDTRVAISRFLQGVDLFRAIDPDMNLGEIATFLNMVLNEESTLREIGEKAGIGMSTIGRYAQDLTELGRKNDGNGHNLVNEVIDPMDRRKRVRQLTPKALKLINSLKLIGAKK